MAEKNRQTKNGSKAAADGSGDAAARQPELQDDDLFDAFEPPTPPDGGWGWAVMIASFFSNMIVDGVCYTYGIFFNELLTCFGSTTSKTALVGALVPAMYLIVGPIVSALANKFGCRSVTIVGSLIAAVFFVASSFSTTIDMMLVTYGIMGGIGFGFMYLPSIVMVGYYFDKRRAMATGIAVCGSSIGTFVFAPLGQLLVDHYGWRGANIVIGAIILNGFVFGLIFRPLEPKRKRVLLPKSTIMQKLASDKRHRTYSVDDRTYITDDGNQVVMTVDGLGDGPSKPVNVESALHQSSTSVRNRSRQPSISASQRSLNARKNAMASPFARKDVLFAGSIENTQEYKSCGDMHSYINSVTNVAEEGDENPSRCAPISRMITEMFDFSLLKSPAFLLICLSGVLGYLGLYTPFVYVTQKAITQLEVEPSKASMILSVLGACNTVARVATGFISDCPSVDCLVVHNVAAIIAGIATGLVSVFNSYELLMLYACIFGIFMAPYIALRSIVLVEILGIQRLTNAFGLMSLFQGIACLIGSPLSGAILDATGSYVGAFVVSGSMFTLAGVVCLPVRRVSKWEKAREERRRNAGHDATRT